MSNIEYNLPPRYCVVLEPDEHRLLIAILEDRIKSIQSAELLKDELALTQKILKGMNW